MQSRLRQQQLCAHKLQDKKQGFTFANVHESVNVEPGMPCAESDCDKQPEALSGGNTDHHALEQNAQIASESPYTESPDCASSMSRVSVAHDYQNDALSVQPHQDPTDAIQRLYACVTWLCLYQSLFSQGSAKGGKSSEHAFDSTVRLDIFLCF